MPLKSLAVKGVFILGAWWLKYYHLSPPFASLCFAVGVTLVHRKSFLLCIYKDLARSAVRDTQSQAVRVGLCQRSQFLNKCMILYGEHLRVKSVSNCQSRDPKFIQCRQYWITVFCIPCIATAQNATVVRKMSIGVGPSTATPRDHPRFLARERYGVS